MRLAESLALQFALPNITWIGSFHQDQCFRSQNISLVLSNNTQEYNQSGIYDYETSIGHNILQGHQFPTSNIWLGNAILPLL